MVGEGSANLNSTISGSREDTRTTTAHLLEADQYTAREGGACA